LEAAGKTFRVWPCIETLTWTSQNQKGTDLLYDMN